MQGEGRWVQKLVHSRVLGCNFECAGSGQERGKLIVDEMPTTQMKEQIPNMN